MGIFAAVCGFVAAICGLYYVWLLQLNGYFFSRAAKNVFCGKFFAVSMIMSCLQVCVCLIAEEFALWSAPICFAVLIPFVAIKKKVPLKFTPRVLRWTAVNLAASVALAYLLGKWFLPAILLPIVLLSSLVLSPVQFLINSYYVNKAKNKIKRMNCVLILVTGSFGKTSIKNILQIFLSTSFKTECSPNSFNTFLGLTKFINSVDFSDRVLILEAGAKKTGDIAKICKTYTPRHAIITGIALQHLSTFKTLDNIIKTKGEVLDFLTHGSFCVLNADNKYVESFFGRGVSTKLSVGKSGEHCSIKNIGVSVNGTTFDLTIGNKTQRIFTPLLGTINACNIAMAFCLAAKMGCDREKLADAAARLPFSPHRLQLDKIKDRYILDDSYNANEVGADAFLEVLSAFKNVKAVVSQGLVEMGELSYEKNYQFGKKLADVADYVALTGQNKAALYDGLTAGGKKDKTVFLADNLNDAVRKLQPFLTTNSVVAFQNDLPDNLAK